MTRLACFISIFLIVMLPTGRAALCEPVVTPENLDHLGQAIVAYNTRIHKNSLSDGSYRGKEGILMMKPEAARSLNLEVPEYPDYMIGMGLYADAERLLKKTFKAMRLQDDYRHPWEEQVLQVAEFALLHKETIKAAREKLKAHRLKLDQDADQRLDESLCSELMVKLLRSSLEETSRNLRDALGHFYNTCNGLDNGDTPLSASNVRFVNFVFNQFTSKNEGRSLQGFDLDRRIPLEFGRLKKGWRSVLGKDESLYLEMIESVLKNRGVSPDSNDILLFLALMKQESRFKPKNVSAVGAAGLTQIMPGTGQKMGMKNIYVPPYYEEARNLLRKERELRQTAMKLIYNITEENKIESSRKAIMMIGEAADIQKKRKTLFARYERELLETGRDERLDPDKSIEYGFEYFSRMMALQGGDMSLALSSYNAGPHRVKYFNGIPPFVETVDFRNRVLRYFKGYIERLWEFESETGNRD